MISPWLGILVFLAGLAVVMTVVRQLPRYVPVHAELSRKLVHILLGLATLSFPWLFDAAWPVVLLAAGTVGIMASIRLVPALRTRFGPVLGGVDRLSMGEFYYPLAVATVFVFSGGDPLLYCVPILILALADAASALIGVRYGTLRFTAQQDRKSVEGSVAFFAIAFMSAHVPLLLFSDVGRAECLLIGVTLGLLVMLMEAIAWRGLDNLLIPIGSFLILRSYLDRQIEEVAALLLFTIAFFSFVMVWRKHTTLKASGLLSGVLIGYLIFSWGGWEWLVPPLVLFTTYTVLWPPSHTSHPNRHDIPAVISVSAAGVVWLVLAKSLGHGELYYPYTIAFAAHLSIIGLARVKHARPDTGVVALIGGCAIKSWLVLFGAFVVVEGPGRATWLLTAAAPIAIVFASAVFYVVQPTLERFPMDKPRWLRQGLSAAIGSAAGLLVLMFV